MLAIAEDHHFDHKSITLSRGNMGNRGIFGDTKKFDDDPLRSWKIW
jgi:hypothetical protein